MSYLLNARLEQGAPTLTLIDSQTGEKRLHWQGETLNNERAWRVLFNRLMLLSCINQLNLHQRAQSPGLGEECLECVQCLERDNKANGQVINLNDWYTNSRRQ